MNQYISTGGLSACLPIIWGALVAVWFRCTSSIRSMKKGVFKIKQFAATAGADGN